MTTHDQQDHHHSSDQTAVRREKLEALKSEGYQFPNHFRPTELAQDLQLMHKSTSTEDLASLHQTVTLSGRMMTRRLMGKASFFNLQDTSGTIQIYARSNDIGV